MDISERMACLYEKDTKEAYANLRELEALSLREDTVYPYVKECIAMLKSDRYVVRVRGFRLLCLQARWDKDGVMNEAMEEILGAVDDEKPTAVRQALQYLAYLAPYKKEWAGRIRQVVLSIDLSRFKDTMMPLIEKDVRALLQGMDAP